MTDYIDKRVLLQVLSLELESEMRGLIGGNSATSLIRRLEKNICEGTYDAKPEPATMESLTERQAKLRVDQMKTDERVRRLFSDAAELEKRVERLEHQNKPREKSPLCSNPPLFGCPFYKQKDDPIQYPCIMCGWFARAKE